MSAHGGGTQLHFQQARVVEGALIALCEGSAWSHDGLDEATELCKGLVLTDAVRRASDAIRDIMKSLLVAYRR